MSSERTPDFAQIAKDVESEILASGASQELLLDQTREALKELRATLADYHHYVSDGAYRLMVEDVDELEARYKALAADTIDAFEHQDYVSVLTQARVKLTAMAMAHHRYATEGSPPKDAGPAPTTARAKGCGLTAVAFVATMVGVAVLLMACGGEAGVEVTRQQYGEAWPFTVERGSVDCDARGNAVFHTRPPDVRGTWALTGAAQTYGYPPIDRWWRDNPAIPGTKVPLTEMIALARRQCR